MSVLLLPPIFQFFDDNGDPLAGGFVDTFAAGTTTRLATYTDYTGTIAAPNPIELDAAGRPTSGSGAIWGQGAYKFIVRNSAGVQVGDALDNVTSFTTLASATNAYFQSFSGNDTQTVFTTSDDLGTEEKAIMVFLNKGLEEIAVNGSFATDTGWTKGAGWTIAAGVATATGGISTAISQVPTISLVPGQAYAVTYTITVSAGTLTASLGGQAGTARSVAGTYREIIVAAASTPIAFTGAGFTGTLDNVSVTVASSAGYDILNPSAYTISGTTLTFATAPAKGTNNIYVFAPSLLLGAASSAAALAQGYAAAALTSQTEAAISAASAAAFGVAKNQWTFSNDVNMSNPGTGNLRVNNSTIGLATQIAISDLSANVGNPDLSGWISTWDDAGGTNRGSIFIFKDNSNFAIFSVNSASTDNTTWFQIPVTYLAGAGTISNTDTILIGFAASGTTTVTGGIIALTGDVTASGTGSVAATIAASAVTAAKLAATLDLTAKTVTVATQAVGNSTTNAASTAFVNSAHPTLTNSLGADVNLNNTGLYFDGPSVAQGTTGTWFASATITIVDTTVSSAPVFNVKLWDGTTVISSASSGVSLNGYLTISLSGFLTNPAGNIKISVNGAGTTTGRIESNISGNTKDSTISVFRLY